MLEELFNLVRGSAGSSVIDNPDVPNEHNDDVVAEATNTVASGMRNMVAGGGLQNLISLFTGKQQGGRDELLSNPIVNMMVGHFAGKLMSKFNLGGQQANNVAKDLIPGVIGDLVKKSNDPDDDTFSLEKLLASITGGQSGQLAQQSGLNLEDLVRQFSGGQNEGSNGGLMDIVSQLAGGAQQQQQRNGGGGLLDLIKGFTK